MCTMWLALLAEMVSYVEWCAMLGYNMYLFQSNKTTWLACTGANSSYLLQTEVKVDLRHCQALSVYHMYNHDCRSEVFDSGQSVSIQSLTGINCQKGRALYKFSYNWVGLMSFHVANNCSVLRFNREGLCQVKNSCFVSFVPDKDLRG